MSRPRIYPDRVYVVATRVRDSFGDYLPEPEVRVMLGERVTRGHYRLSVVREASTADAGLYRLEDGHVPAFQPVTEYAEALRWLTVNPHASIIPVTAPHRAEGGAK